jgi:hypothetical protein
MHPSNAKQLARQIVRESFKQVLARSYRVPSIEDIESVLSNDPDYTFDEGTATFRIRRSHPAWSEVQLTDELERERLAFEKRKREKLRVAAMAVVDEIENLLKSFDQTITQWKVMNL